MKDRILSLLEKFAKFEINLDSLQARELMARELLLVINDEKNNHEKEIRHNRDCKDS